ncbi:DUF6773 family protein [Desulforamulus reducens]|nr:DUF6773 family protein [Desulforamulus reducens]
MKDERIEQAKNKIRSEMALVVFIGVVVSFLVKTLVYKMTLQECITEYVIMIFFPAYQFIRMHMMKISIYSQRGNKQSVKNLLIIIAVLVVASAVYGGKSAVSGIFTFLALFIAIFFITNKYNQYAGHKFEEEFDDDNKE